MTDDMFEVPGDRLRQMTNDIAKLQAEVKRLTLTIEQARLLGDLIHGVERKCKMHYYPYGADTSDATMNVLTVVLRAFTNEGGGGFYPHDSDIRDSYVWTSAIFEHWFKVDDLIVAMDNAVTGKNGTNQPMAVIDKE
jgi:hypothetical protein